jgi:uncharacterized oxidoreductase
MKLEGNTVLITGGNSGIGLEMARQLIQRGNTVVVTGRDMAKLDRARAQLPRLQTLQSDVSRVEDIEALYARVTKDFPTLNILVNNAGVMRAINMHRDQPSLDDLTTEIDINLKGPVRMARRFLPHLKRQTSAAVLNVSSGLAFVPLPISPIYSATKAAIHSFSISLRAQLQSTSVKVFELLPPVTQTDLLGEFESGDLKGVAVMKVDAMVRRCLEGIEKDHFEITPGQSSQLKLMNRLAPAFIQSQLNKPVRRMLD